MRLLLKNLLFTVLVPATVGFWIPYWLAPPNPAPACLRLASIAPFVLGSFVYDRVPHWKR